MHAKNIESCTPDALKFANKASCTQSAWPKCPREAGRFFTVFHQVFYVSSFLHHLLFLWWRQIPWTTCFTSCKKPCILRKKPGVTRNCKSLINRLSGFCIPLFYSTSAYFFLHVLSIHHILTLFPFVISRKYGWLLENRKNY